jgi:uncharacterized membrane protein YkoI
MAATSAQADEKAEAAEAAKNAAVLATAMKEAKVSLASGLQASEKEGRPISGKFEVEDGKLQLSVYTMKGDKFFEVVVDHRSGKIMKTEPISSGDDLAEAKKQAEAMAKAKRSLREVVASAEKANPGFKAVGIEAELRNGTAQADVALLKGAESMHIEEKL